MLNYSYSPNAFRDSWVVLNTVLLTSGIGVSTRFYDLNNINYMLLRYDMKQR